MEPTNYIFSSTIYEFHYFTDVISVLRGICKSDVSRFAESEFARFKSSFDYRERRVINVYLIRKAIMD